MAGFAVRVIACSVAVGVLGVLLYDIVKWVRDDVCC